jgi:ATP-binding cassette, subfamily B, bacterial HlyB/CyaB
VIGKQSLYNFMRMSEEEVAIRERAEGVDQRIQLAQGITEEEFSTLQKKKEVRRFPEVRQNTDADSGAACLTMRRRCQRR